MIFFTSINGDPFKMIVDNAQIIPKIMVVNFLKYNAIESENEEINDAYPIFFKISNLDSRSSEYKFNLEIIFNFDYINKEKVKS